MAEPLDTETARPAGEPGLTQAEIRAENTEVRTWLAAVIGGDTLPDGFAITISHGLAESLGTYGLDSMSMTPEGEDDTILGERVRSAVLRHALQDLVMFAPDDKFDAAVARAEEAGELTRSGNTVSADLLREKRRESAPVRTLMNAVTAGEPGAILAAAQDPAAMLLPQRLAAALARDDDGPADGPSPYL